MIAFFVTIKPEGCDPNDGDMLLYQWGTYDWGQGKHFELDITRQFVEQEREDDDAISQLNITYKFEPTAQLEALGAGNRWCEGPAEIETMRAYIFSSSPYITVVDCKAIRVDVTYSYV